MIKLIATDMDGTLVRSDGTISDEFPGVYDQIREKDVRFVVASGRQYAKLREVFKDYPGDIAYIADNGTMVMYKEEKLYSKAMKEDHVRGIIDYTRSIDSIHLVLSGEEKAYVDTDKEEVIEELEKYYKEYEVVDDLYEVKENILKIAVYAPGNVEKLYDEHFAPRWGDKTKVSVSGEVWMDIYNHATNKGIALNMIQKKFDISKDQTLVFGDYFNDTPMLKEAKYSYAMENAPEEFKKDANFIAKSNDEDGVIKVIRERLDLK